jgi:uncharacterized protein
MPLDPDATPRPILSPVRPEPSPCVRLCTLNEQDVCLGCGRTLTDITSWTKMTPAQQAECVARGRASLLQLGRPLPSYPPLPLKPALPRRR